MAIVINGTGAVTGVTNVGSASANTPVVLQDSGSNTNTCRAWVNFDGTGTVAIRASFNVSSITDNGVGDYTVNFTTAMPDANYSAITTVGDTTGAPNNAIITAGALSTSSVSVKVSKRSDGAADDRNQVTVATFR
jgi:hypothetical protein